MNTPATLTPATLAETCAALLEHVTPETVAAFETAVGDYIGHDLRTDCGDAFRWSNADVAATPMQRVSLIQIAAMGNPCICSHKGLALLDVLYEMTECDAVWQAREEVAEELGVAA